MEIIEIKNLNFSYKDKQVLKNISLNIEKTKITGIIGPNGCGKSTLAKNIIKYLVGSYEYVKVDGRDLREISFKDLAKLISYIPQKINIVNNISVFDFILLGRYPLLKNTWDFYQKEDFDAVNENIKLLKIEELKNRNIESLSGGELQKVLLAKALVQEAKILLLDEPTSALDLNNAVEFMKILQQVCKKKSITAVIIIHDLNLATLFCEELIILKNGEFIVKGEPKEVINEENMRDIYNLDCSVLFNSDGKLYIIPKI
ncbi:MAG: ABC transporter ATP-binding protein [Fusobacterium gastrosuis]|uniref:ABC transporter ATP-binding protein n=1 Tax=Fusobacterium TaxID=848 RepID=UPI0025C33356|nr:ABC transporter ATP-binding protein [Fusobacterium sp.]MCI7223551.1 ABC transporter ATP-binding protein [Fusobacterium sp.]MDD7392023.1 ABC transporter ATP-binding protein [Fusobacteriaceae bacterium]MDY5795585.1 ABC transporter ATP-binding protein [Fusobacterium gastrosuis]